MIELVQFFITYERQPHLNNVYTVFGRVLNGWDVLNNMERLPVEGEAAMKKMNKHRPVNPPVIMLPYTRTLWQMTISYTIRRMVRLNDELMWRDDALTKTAKMCP